METSFYPVIVDFGKIFAFGIAKNVVLKPLHLKGHCKNSCNTPKLVDRAIWIILYTAFQPSDFLSSRHKYWHFVRHKETIINSSRGGLIEGKCVRWDNFGRSQGVLDWRMQIRRLHWDQSKLSRPPRTFDFLFILGRFNPHSYCIFQSLWWLHKSSRCSISDLAPEVAWKGHQIRW